jgi:hypothetical protein
VPISHVNVANVVEVSETELPILLTAKTLAFTSEPVTRLYGVALSVVIGTVHYRFDMMVESDPLQLVRSYVNVLPFDYMIAIWYDVMGEPLALGADQLMITLLPLSVVTGGYGVLGAVAASQLPAAEGTEKPKAFLAKT